MLCYSLCPVELLVTVLVMDGSRVTQSLEFLWFYTNILTCRDKQVASLTDHFNPLIHDKEPPHRDLEKPNAPFLVNLQNVSDQNVENIFPRCPKCGEISSAFEAKRVISNNWEMLKSERETEKRERRKRRKRSMSGPNGTKVNNHGGPALRFDVKEVTGFLKFQESCVYQMHAAQQQTKMPPIDDDVAMKEHLKSWAYAVACNVK